MKKKGLVALICVLAVSSVALAAEYSIRVTYNTNLRATNNLDARIVETAPAGATLSVIGSSGRWLRISRNGGDVWMAEWVSHDRVEGGQPMGTQQQPSNIDNCCFVDRQCATDQDWTDGYWAFQNGQCSAPAQTQVTTVTQPMTTTSSAVDNCCFVDRQCTTDQDWTDGYWAFQNGQCSAPGQSQVQTSSQPASAASADANNCCFLGWQCQTDEEWARGFHAYQTNECEHPGIAIEGSPGFVEQMHAALDLLRNGSAYWYDFVIRGLDRIRQTPPEVIGVNVSERTFYLDYGDRPPPGVSLDHHTTHDASMLIHEACHVHRYEAGLEAGGLPGEKACVETEIRALEEIAPASGWIPGLRNVVANIDRPECQWWWGEYRSCW